MTKAAENKYGAVIIEGHVQGLANTRSLGKAGIPVIVIDKGSCVAASSRYCQSFFICPDYQEESFIDFIIELAQSENLANWVLIPSNDHAVYNISKNLQRIKDYYKTTIPSIDIIDQIYNKANLLNLADSLNVPIPETYYFNDTSDILISELKYPVLTKGKTGLSFYKRLKRKAFLSNDRKELIGHLEIIKKELPLEETFSQELIPFDGNNKTISLAAFCIDGEIKTYWMGVKLREHPIQFGTATYTESVFEEDCLKESKVLLKELNYTGVCEVEFLKDPRDSQFKLIEINARTWLWVGHAIANGINFPLYIYNYLNDVNISYPTQYELGLKWRNPFSDVILHHWHYLKEKSVYLI
jgi:predicted ATP-grasp superfamily ATP-dependent carboligase